MRINIMNRNSWKTYKELLHGWVKDFATEFDIEETQAQRYLYESPDVVAEFLREHGWNIVPYELPQLVGDVLPSSKGFELDVTCAPYVSWRLTYT
jgi:hypothetical protein